MSKADKKICVWAAFKAGSVDEFKTLCLGKGVVCSVGTLKIYYALQ